MDSSDEEQTRTGPPRDIVSRLKNEGDRKRFSCLWYPKEIKSLAQSAILYVLDASRVYQTYSEALRRGCSHPVNTGWSLAKGISRFTPHIIYSAFYLQKAHKLRRMQERNSS